MRHSILILLSLFSLWISVSPVTYQALAQTGPVNFEELLKTSNYHKATVVGLTYSKSYFDTLKQKGLGHDPLKFYRAALVSSGVEVLEISQYDSAAMLAKKMARIDTLVLPGGIDVDSQFYTKEPKFIDKFQSSDIEFDLFQFKLIRDAQLRKLPLLGICRGSQLINVALGGTLYQDLESFNRNITQQHLKRSNAGVAAAEEHLLLIDTNSRYAKVLGVSEIRGNSWHHQAVLNLGNGLHASMMSPDNVIEGFESTSDWKVMGIQSHPEKALADDGKSRFSKLFDYFADEGKKFHNLQNSQSRLMLPNIQNISEVMCREESILRLKLH